MVGTYGPGSDDFQDLGYVSYGESRRRLSCELAHEAPPSLPDFTQATTDVQAANSKDREPPDRPAILSSIPELDTAPGL